MDLVDSGRRIQFPRCEEKSMGSEYLPRIGTATVAPAFHDSNWRIRDEEEGGQPPV